jgi:hypothetical protein
MTERVVVQDGRGKVSSQPLPGKRTAGVSVAKCCRAPVQAAERTPLHAETASAPWPPDRAATWLVEVLAKPWPPLDGPVFVVEVLRRDTASSAIVATGMDAFGDTPWPQAQRGVFAFRHDWAEPLVERLEWQTSVTRLASGNESRQARRKVPRRTLTYQVGNARRAMRWWPTGWPIIWASVRGGRCRSTPWR